MVTVVVILGIVAGMAITRFGHDTLATVDAEGVARRVTLAMRLARRQAISEGVNAAVILSPDGTAVSSFTVVRAAASGDEPVEAVMPVASGVTMVATAARWEFDYTGALATPSGGTVTITSPGWTWTITMNALTGQPRLSRVAS
ncbi:hypothetical protein Pla111_06480 [Botrimarina hoheduenensis]|uniref:Type II secretion system protein H n=2 Tax=Botrimarina hoheduenensis TaxID=2528000 RepID=A0A5C5WGG3_9BACT|nr:hypothetical protein Pla111_06480 [Botrimarina hoheduenensis]